MKRHILAVCDLEKAYVYRLMEYLNQKKNIPFELQVFTDPEQLLKFAGEHFIEILLISDRAVSGPIRGLSLGQMIILNEGMCSPELKEYPSIYKYQSSDVVLREIMTCYGEEVETAPGALVYKSSMELLAVYSPLGRVQKTSFALTLGQLLAKEKPTLYLNLEEYSGFEGLFSVNYEKTLGDLLYFVRQSKPNLISKLHGMVQTVNHLDYLPPVLSPQDIRDTAYDQWKELLDALEQQSIYEAVILDMGGSVDGWLRILERCDRIYMPVRTDWVSRSKIQQFENLLRLRDCESLLEKIQSLQPPAAMLEEKENYAEQLLWSEMGDFVRGFLV